MKSFISALFVLFLSTSLFSQTVYYSSDGKNRLTQQQLDESRLEFKERISKIMGKEMFVEVKITETLQLIDSIIKKVEFETSDKETIELKSKNVLVTMKGQKFPDFELTSINGASINLEKFIGKPTMINFWFTRCAPCIDEMPSLNKIAKKFGDKINFLAITYESIPDVQKFLNKRKFDFYHLVDAESFTDEIGIESYPTNVYLDSNGFVQKVEGGIAYVLNEKGELKMGNGDEIIKILESLE